jgi:hypothetical protein
MVFDTQTIGFSEENEEEEFSSQIQSNLEKYNGGGNLWSKMDPLDSLAQNTSFTPQETPHYENEYSKSGKDSEIIVFEDVVPNNEVIPKFYTN